MAVEPATVEALLFDLDGTLADTSTANVEAYALALAEFGVQANREELAMRSHGRNWRQFLPPLLAQAGSAAQPAAVAERKAALYAGLMGSIRINTALVALLVSCRPWMKTALVTTASCANVTSVLEAHRLHTHFDTIVTGDDVLRHKPDPHAYLLAAERLATSPANCLVFEDSDIGEESGRAAGMQVLRVVLAG